MFISKDKSPLFTSTHIIIAFTLVLAFSIKNIFYFYFSFEISLLPISIMVLGWGYQPERIRAYIFIFIYTVASSLPLLIMVITRVNYFRVNFFFELNKLLLTNPENILANFHFLLLFIGFLVKFPMYGLHLWLPKAHVEAPVGGSIVLASLLLKLGGFGIINLRPLISKTGRIDILNIFRAIGGFIISILCLRQVDIKVLIAYSSVAHLRVSLITCISKRETALYRRIVVIVAHGISSPGIFLGSYQIYTRRHSRNMLLNSGFLGLAPAMTLWWFILCLANIGAPPTLNLLGELLGFIRIYSINFLYFLPFSGLIFLGGAYTLIIFSSSQQGQKKKIILRNNPFFIRENFSLGLLTLFRNLSLYILIFLI